MSYQKNTAQRVSSHNSSVSEDLATKNSRSLPAIPAIQRMEDEEEPVQGKFQTAQLAAEEEEPLQGKFATAQLAAEEEEPLQGKFATAQLEAEEEEPLQGKFSAQLMEDEEEPVQGKFETAQLAAEEEEPVQGKFEAAQLAAEEEEPLQGKMAPVQRQEGAGSSGLPASLKGGIENMSGMDMSDVKVHYNSDKPAQLNALAYAQGSDIHVASGQEKHLPHEAWHVVQQRQGRVQATKQMKMGVPVNDDKGLETEADVMGAKAAATGTQLMEKPAQRKPAVSGSTLVAQRETAEELAFMAKNTGIINLVENAKDIAGKGFWASLAAGEDNLETATTGGEVTSGLTGASADATNKATGASDASEQLQKTTKDDSRFVAKAEGDILGAIGSTLSVVVNMIKGIRSTYDAAKGNKSKMDALPTAGKSFGEAVKSGYEAAAAIQKYTSGSVSGHVMSVLPGLSLALAAADVLIAFYKAYMSDQAQEQMTVISGEYKVGLTDTLGGSAPERFAALFQEEKRGKFGSRITYLRLKPDMMERMEIISKITNPAHKLQSEKVFKSIYKLPTVMNFDAFYMAVRMYEMGSKMQEINQKRKVSGMRNVGTSLLQVGGAIADLFPGTGTIVGLGLKGAATAINLGQVAAKGIQGAARNRGALGADINRGEKAKHKEYVNHTRTLYQYLGGLHPIKEESKVAKAEQLISSTGVYPPALYKTDYMSEPDIQDQATQIVDAMKSGR